MQVLLKIAVCIPFWYAFLDLKTQFEEKLLPLCEYNYGHNLLQDSRYMTSLYIGGVLLLFTNGSQ